ncbi:hypothetical protein D3C81_1291580 [compost metagenome]
MQVSETGVLEQSGKLRSASAMSQTLACESPYKLRRLSYPSGFRCSVYACRSRFDESTHASPVQLLQGRDPPRSGRPAVCPADHCGGVADAVSGVSVRSRSAQVVDHGGGHCQPAVGRNGAGTQFRPGDRHDAWGSGGSSDHGDLSPGPAAIHYHSGTVAGAVHGRRHVAALHQLASVCAEWLHRCGRGAIGNSRPGRHVSVGGNPRHGNLAGRGVCMCGQSADGEAASGGQGVFRQSRSGDQTGRQPCRRRASYGRKRSGVPAPANATARRDQRP